jgi:hypothetical protein
MRKSKRYCVCTIRPLRVNGIFLWVKVRSSIAFRPPPHLLRHRERNFWQSTTAHEKVGYVDVAFTTRGAFFSIHATRDIKKKNGGGGCVSGAGDKSDAFFFVGGGGCRSRANSLPAAANVEIEGEGWRGWSGCARDATQSPFATQPKDMSSASAPSDGFLFFFLLCFLWCRGGRGREEGAIRPNAPAPSASHASGSADFREGGLSRRHRSRPSAPLRIDDTPYHLCAHSRRRPRHEAESARVILPPLVVGRDDASPSPMPSQRHRRRLRARAS